MLNFTYENSILDEITNPKHMFWETGISSSMTLSRSKNRSIIMRISVHSMRAKIVYKIEFICSNTSFNSVLYHYKNDTITLIKEGWMKYYENDTFVSYAIIDMIDLSLMKQTSLLSPRYLCKSSLSPRKLKLKRSNSLQ